MSSTKSKESIAVFFGGISLEHEISVITALQAMQAIDSSRYQIHPVYIATDGKWFTGDALFEKEFYQKKSINTKKVKQVTLLPDPNYQALFPLNTSYVDLDQAIPIDIGFLAFHGQYGEDGCIQGLLELANIPYTGCNHLASAVTMNKYQCSRFLKAHGVPVLDAVALQRKDFIQSLEQSIHTIRDQLKLFPLIVKPCSLGSSRGIAIAQDEKELTNGLANVFNYDSAAIIEPYINDLLEINVAVIDDQKPIASVVEIPVSSGTGLLSYEDKYLRGGAKTGESEGMASLTRIIDPKDLSSEIKKMVTDYASHAFQLLNLSGIVRFDFMYDTKKDKLYFNELNSIPGSLAYYLFEKSHPPLLYTDVINKMLESAKKRSAEKHCLKQNLPFEALK